MSKAAKKTIDRTLLFTLVVIAGITLIGIIFTWVNCGKPWTITSYDDMKEVTYYTYKTQDQDEYFVFVYSKAQDTSKELEASVSDYADYVRLHSGKKIYVLNFNDGVNDKIADDLSISDRTKVARLVLIKDGAISTKYTDWDDINNALQDSKDED